MADNTGIEWTDATWNPIRARNRATGKVGWHCEHVSPGCANCYAEPINAVRFGTALPFKPGHRDDVEIFLDEKTLLEPLRWRRPRKIFVGSMTDLFGDWVTDAMLDRIFAVMALCPQHTFQVLTKRPARMRSYMVGHKTRVPYLGRLPLERIHIEATGHMKGDGGFMDVLKNAGNVYSLYLNTPWPLPNVWLGVSAEDQTRADERVPDLLATPAAIRFVSAEPLLGPIDFNSIKRPAPLGSMSALPCEPGGTYLDWIIVGGESGPNARAMHPQWARHIRDQCEPGVPFFFKQWGEWAPRGPASRGYKLVEGVPRLRMTDTGANGSDIAAPGDNHVWMQRAGKKAAGRLLDGVEHNGMPEATRA